MPQNTLKSASVSYSTTDSASTSQNKKGFWEVNGYNYALRRMECSSALVENMLAMYEEISMIEAKYGRSLSEWVDKWSKGVGVSSGSDECYSYGTWKYCLERLIDSVADKGKAHVDNWTQIQANCIDPLRRLLQDNFQRSTFNSPRNIKELREDFKTAQVSYIEALHKVKKAYTKYTGAVDFSQSVTVDEDIGNVENMSSKKKKQAEKLRKRYEERKAQIDLVIPHYCQKMTEQYMVCDNIERTKLQVIGKTFRNFSGISTLECNARYLQFTSSQKEAIAKLDIEADLDYWSRFYGPKSKFEIPRFGVPLQSSRETGFMGSKKKLPLGSSPSTLVSNNPSIGKFENGSCASDVEEDDDDDDTICISMPPFGSS